ncbi:MAG: hypothetical protein U1E93_00780 [Alphaproteobacteria bacterium]
MRKTIQNIAIGITVFGTALLWNEASAGSANEGRTTSSLAHGVNLTTAEIHSLAGSSLRSVSMGF